ncbi:helix-turn-helix domain-containing protein [Streptomyces sp. NPDC014735]|uniref:helix-turn-helix domain-containing protein n=1 Tax=unclassified Streptomyces TaxID=2593676 RepID=UPI0036FCFCB8
MKYHGLEVRQKALTLLRSGAKGADVARQLNVPRGTVSYWLHMDRFKRGECPGSHHPTCHRCDGADLIGSAYAYLLGLYLGDGYVSQYARHRVPNLVITLDDSWPGIQDEAETAMREVFPDNATSRVRRAGCHNIKVHSKHLLCLFPQHGPGKKHDREIALEPWQQMVVDSNPWDLIRGLIHSDGCRITNWTTRLVAGERKRYEYPRYFLANKSDDIRKLFGDTLTAVGVQWTTLARGSDPFVISVARRASVALMDAHVGPKY